LGIIHSNGLLPALLRAIGLYTLIGTLGVLLLSHVADPLGSRVTNDWSTSIAADLVSRSMIPHRFTALGGGVSMVIGGRDSRGNISDFFADDPRDPDSHRTYFARAAIITHDEQGYVLRMRDGAVQYLSADGRFSQVAFKQYDQPMDQFAADAGAADGLGQTPSYDLVATALETGHWDPAVVKILLKRSGEGLRVLALCALVAALALFPSGRRRADAPVEIAVLGAAFIERALTSYIVGPGIFSVASGSVIILIGAAAILCVRLRVFRPIRWRRRAAA
jgi:lipopolysaccharide export system permease protein